MIWLLAGCSVGISDKNLEFISPQEAYELLTEGSSNLIGSDLPTLVVDPRPTWSYRKGHIPQAINIPFGQIRLQLWQLDDAGTIIISGETHNDPVALALSKELIKQGFSDIKTMRGGLTGWEAAGHPVSATQ